MRASRRNKRAQTSCPRSLPWHSLSSATAAATAAAAATGGRRSQSARASALRVQPQSPWHSGRQMASSRVTASQQRQVAVRALKSVHLGGIICVNVSVIWCRCRRCVRLRVSATAVLRMPTQDRF